MDVIGVGLANIDLIAYVEESFLTRHRLLKGHALKLDDLAFGRLRADLNVYHAVPGGCVANTLCGLSLEGIATQFYGKIGADSFESLYRASFDEYGVAYDVAPSPQESSQCAVLVTPDGERSFAYTHAASWDLSAADIDEEIVAQANLLYMEVYAFAFGPDGALAASLFENAAKHNTALAMKIMDGQFGKKYAQDIKALADAHTLTLLTGNHANLPAVAGAKDWKDAIETFKLWQCDVLMLAGLDGAYFISGGRAEHYPVEPLMNPKNTSGAGDQYIAGFLKGWLEGRPVAECAAQGAMSARLILGHDAARPPLATRQGISFEIKDIH